MKRIKITLASIMIFGLFTPALSFGQTQPLEQPQNINQIKQIGQRALTVLKDDLPRIIKTAWQNEVLPVWQKMFNWLKINIWQRRVKAWLDNIWQAVKRIFNSEIEKRTPTAKENFETEKGQLKEEVPQVSKSLWEKFKELIK